MKYIGAVLILLSVAFAGVFGGYKYAKNQEPSVEKCITSFTEQATEQVKALFD